MEARSPLLEKKWISTKHHQWKCGALCLEKDGCLLRPQNWFSAWDLLNGTWAKEKWRICVVTKPLSTMYLRKIKREWDGFRGLLAGAWVLRRVEPHTNNAGSTWMFFSFSSSAKGQTTQTTPLTMWSNATHFVKLSKKTRESSKRNYYIISPRVIMKAIIIRTNFADLTIWRPAKKERKWWYLHLLCGHHPAMLPFPTCSVYTLCLFCYRHDNDMPTIFLNPWIPIGAWIPIV